VSWSGRSVLVTGAGGFIGSHLAEALVECGARVRAMVRYNALGRRGWLDASDCLGSMEIIAGDFSDRDSVRTAVAGTEVIFHLGALIAIPYSYRAPVSYLRTNAEGTLNVLQAALDHGVSRVVHTSTSEVYGTARFAPITEEHPLQGQSPYAASKIAADKMAEAFHLSFGLPVVTARPFNTYGPRQSLRAVVPTIIAQCLDGSRVRLGHLHPTRDLNYVGDTVNGLIAAAESNAAIGRTVNLGTGREIAIGDLARLIGDLMGREVALETEAERNRPEASEVNRLMADNALAADLLGWRPATSLEDGLQRTINWFRDRGDRVGRGDFAL